MGYRSARAASAPIGTVDQRDPDRHAQRSRQIRDCGIDGDHQVHVQERGCQIDERLRIEVCAEIDHWKGGFGELICAPGRLASYITGYRGRSPVVENGPMETSGGPLCGSCCLARRCRFFGAIGARSRRARAPHAPGLLRDTEHRRESFAESCRRFRAGSAMTPARQKPAMARRSGQCVVHLPNSRTNRPAAGWHSKTTWLPRRATSGR